MRRRERVEGGPAEQTLESLLGLHVHPRTMRQAAHVWEQLTAQGIDDRDAHWRHPDCLPQIPAADGAAGATDGTDGTDKGTASRDDAAVADDSPATAVRSDAAAGDAASTQSNDNAAASPAHSIDWDAELAKLLDDVNDTDDNSADDTNDPPTPPTPPAPPSDAS